MSHEFETGLFSNNEPAWHGLGTVMPYKVYDLEEALIESGLDWTVSKKPLMYSNEDDDSVVEMDNYYALVRDTDNQLLNPCVSKTYVPLQNRDAFEFFAPFLHEKECFITSAISLSRGKKVCLVASIEDNIQEVVPNDTVKSYLLLATSHDGSLATTTKFCKERTVCANTLHSALAEDGAFRTVRHTASQKEVLAQIQSSIDLFKKDFDNEIKIYKQLANKEMDLDTVKSYLERLFEKDLVDTAKRLKKPLDEVSLEDNRFTKRCLESYLNSPDLQMEHVAGTAWAGFNCVTEAIKFRSNNLDNRLNSIWFGPDGKLIERAKALALSI